MQNSQEDICGGDRFYEAPNLQFYLKILKDSQKQSV